MISSLQNLSLRVSAAVTTFALTTPVFAQDSLFGTVPDIGGGASADIRLTVVNILKRVLSFMALVAVVLIVIAGIRLVVSQGEEAERDKARKTIFYVIIGLIIILLAQAIVDFVADQIGSASVTP